MLVEMAEYETAQKAASQTVKGLRQLVEIAATLSRAGFVNFESPLAAVEFLLKQSAMDKDALSTLRARNARADQHNCRFYENCPIS
jgi:hypothetical protein